MCFPGCSAPLLKHHWCHQMCQTSVISQRSLSWHFSFGGPCFLCVPCPRFPLISQALWSPQLLTSCLPPPLLNKRQNNMDMETCNSNTTVWPQSKYLQTDAKSPARTYCSVLSSLDGQRFVFSVWSPAEPVVQYWSNGLHHHKCNTWRFSNTWQKWTLCM